MMMNTSRRYPDPGNLYYTEAFYTCERENHLLIHARTQDTITLALVSQHRTRYEESIEWYIFRCIASLFPPHTPTFIDEVLEIHACFSAYMSDNGLYGENLSSKEAWNAATDLLHIGISLVMPSWITVDACSLHTISHRFLEIDTAVQAGQKPANYVALLSQGQELVLKLGNVDAAHRYHALLEREVRKGQLSSCECPTPPLQEKKK